MSDYIYHIGNDYDCINKEYVILSTDKGQQITVALTASRVPFKGRYDEESIIFDYDGDYKESVDEIIENLTFLPLISVRIFAVRSRNIAGIKTICSLSLWWQSSCV